MKNKARLATLFVYATAITVLSLLPGSSDLQLNIWDKLQHLTAYWIFMLLACPWPSTLRVRAVAAVSLLIYSGLIELAQGLSPGRSPSLADLVANALGIALATTMIFFWQRSGAASE